MRLEITEKVRDFVGCYNFGRNLEFGESFRHVILHFEELKRLEVERKVSF